MQMVNVAIINMNHGQHTIVAIGMKHTWQCSSVIPNRLEDFIETMDSSKAPIMDLNQYLLVFIASSGLHAF
jgi:hypothetical protein